MVTYLPSRRPSKLDEQDMEDTAGESRTNSLATFYWPLQTNTQVLDEQLEHIYDSYVRIQDVARKRWMIETDGKKELGKSKGSARDDDDDY